jgi:hypothetical protein
LGIHGDEEGTGQILLGRQERHPFLTMMSSLCDIRLGSCFAEGSGLKNCQLMRPDDPDWWKSSLVRVSSTIWLCIIFQVLNYKHE